MPLLEGFTDELGDRTTAIGNPYKMGKNGHDERLRDAVCDAHIQYLELDPAAASPQRLAAATTNIARESVRGYSYLQPPPNASQTPIAARMQDCRDMQLALAQRVATGESIRLLCHCPPGKRCHLQAVASRVRTLASSLASPVPPCSICDTNDGGDEHSAADAAAPAAELSASCLFGRGGEDPQLQQLPSPQPTPLFPPLLAGYGGASPPLQQLPPSPQLMPATPPPVPVPLAQPLSTVLAHMASIATGSTELSPGQRRRSAVYAVRTAAHGTAARVLGSVMPSTWIALAFVYTLRRQAEESSPAIGR
jgi:hypothetical protein